MLSAHLQEEDLILRSYENEHAYVKNNKQPQKYCLDFPPAYPNSEDYHLGHYYEMFLAYVYYRFMDSRTRDQLVSGCTRRLIDQTCTDCPEYDLALNFGYDTNGLPLTLKCKRDQKESYEALHERCKALAQNNVFALEHKASAMGLLSSRNVKRYLTEDEFFRKKSETLLDRLRSQGRITSERRPLLYCPNCRSHVSAMETSYEDNTCTEYRVSVLIDSRQYEVMTKFPEYLAYAKGIAFSPKDPRYKGLQSKTARITLPKSRILEVPVYASEHVNVKAGTGLTYFCNWASELDLKISRDLRLGGESDLYDDTGALKTERLSEYGHESLQKFLQSCLDQSLVRIVGPSETKVLRHTERGSCRAPVVFISANEESLELNEGERRTLEALILRTKYNKEYTRTHLLDSLRKYHSWCISRDPNQYYSFVYDTSGEKHRCLDTWFMSSLTPQVNSEHSLRKIRIQGSDILRTWAFFSLWTSMLLGQSGIDRLITHRMIVDSSGQKFSKSKGNVVRIEDLLPNEYTEEDVSVLRTYLLQKPLDKDIRLNEKQISDHKKFRIKFRNLKKKLALTISTVDPEEFKRLLSQYVFGESKTERCLSAFYQHQVQNAEFGTAICTLRSEVYKLSRNLVFSDVKQLVKAYVTVMLINDFFSFF